MMTRQVRDLERELARVLASGECCIECQYGASDRCDCICGGRFHGVAILLPLARNTEE